MSNYVKFLFLNFIFGILCQLQRVTSFSWVMNKQLFLLVYICRELTPLITGEISFFLANFELTFFLLPLSSCRVVTRLMLCALWSSVTQNVQGLLWRLSKVLVSVTCICCFATFTLYSFIHLLVETLSFFFNKNNNSVLIK